MVWFRSPGGRPARLLAALLTFTALICLSRAASGHEDGECPCCLAPSQAVHAMAERGGPLRSAGRRGLTQVGFLPLRGFNADVWAYKGFAYVGSEGSGSTAGVAVVDATNPRTPRLLGRVAAIPQTTTEDVMVRHIETPAFSGDLLAVGIQARDEDSAGARGIDLWNVTNPRSPVHLAFWPDAPFTNTPSPARGVHELYLFQQGSRAFVAGMVPDAEEYERRGDFRLVEVTDPRRPVLTSIWSAFDDGGLPDNPYPWGHSVTVNAAGTVAIVSWWDAGTIFLDIRNPARPVMMGRILKPSGPNGNAHSVWLAQNENTLLVCNENLRPLPGQEPWGFLRVWDIRNLSATKQLGKFATPNAAAVPARSRGIFCVHNAVVQGNMVYMSWYSDGVRAVDISNPAAPRDAGYFVPSGASMWGIYADRGLVYASDISAGLYILSPGL